MLSKYLSKQAVIGGLLITGIVMLVGILFTALESEAFERGNLIIWPFAIMALVGISLGLLVSFPQFFGKNRKRKSQ